MGKVGVPWHEGAPRQGHPPAGKGAVTQALGGWARTWPCSPLRLCLHSKSGRTRPNENVAIISPLFLCISNLFREQERYLTIT